MMTQSHSYLYSEEGLGQPELHSKTLFPETAGGTLRNS